MTARGILGETLTVDRRLRTPTAGAMAAGDPIDAGSVMILDSNLSKLAQESFHHLASAIGPGTLFSSSVLRGFGGLNDAAEPSATGGVDAVAWSIVLSMAFGPFDLCVDRVTAAQNLPRKVKVFIDFSGGGASTLTVYAALVVGSSRPSPGNTLDFKRNVLGAGAGTTELILTPKLFEQSTIPDRSIASRCAYADVRLWVAWYATNAADAIYSINAWETL